MTTAERKESPHVHVGPEKMAEIASWFPNGFKFQKAAFTKTEHGDSGVRVWFAKEPIDPPTPVFRKHMADQFAATFRRPLKSARYMQGQAGLELELDDGTKLQVARQIADMFFDYHAVRRPTLRLLSPRRAQAIDADLLRMIATPAGFRPDQVIMDICLKITDAVKFFGLGENVEIRGVRGIWQGEPIVGRGVCTGFLLRCATTG